MSEYLKIISQWGSKAQEGRNQAKKEQEMLLKTKQKGEVVEIPQEIASRLNMKMN